MSMIIKYNVTFTRLEIVKYDLFFSNLSEGN